MKFITRKSVFGVFWYPGQSNTKPAVQPQKLAGSHDATRIFSEKSNQSFKGGNHTMKIAPSKAHQNVQQYSSNNFRKIKAKKSPITDKCFQVLDLDTIFSQFTIFIYTTRSSTLNFVLGSQLLENNTHSLIYFLAYLMIFADSSKLQR